MELLIVTGLSGAGKTRVINALEDIGFYCVDNIPPALLGGFADLCYSPAAHHGRSAIVMDSRSGKMFRELPHALEELRPYPLPYPFPGGERRGAAAPLQGDPPETSAAG